LICKQTWLGYIKLLPGISLFSSFSTFTPRISPLDRLIAAFSAPVDTNYRPCRSLAPVPVKPPVSSQGIFWSQLSRSLVLHRAALTQSLSTHQNMKGPVVSLSYHDTSSPGSRSAGSTRFSRAAHHLPTMILPPGRTTPS